MDCEGGEGDIIDSLQKSDMKKIKKIILEYHDNVSCLKHQDIILKLEK